MSDPVGHGRASALSQAASPRGVQAGAGLDAGARDAGSLSDTWQRLARERTELEDAERALLERAVKESRGVLAHAARALKIPRTTLLSRLARAGIEARARLDAAG